jgi:hypothetical protein
MRNRVEILRAVEFTKDDLDNIKNLNEIYSFSAKEKEFMEEFKKIYELGLNQLEKFINKLDSEGSSLDAYTIQYYIRQLLSGPLASYAKQLGDGKKYFSNIPDIVGVSGNIQSSSSNTSIISNSPTPIGQTSSIFNKIPSFLKTLSAEVCKSTENAFRDGMKSTIYTDNTLPIVNKVPQVRVNTENNGKWQSSAHGTYCVRDRSLFFILQKVNSKVAESVKTKFSSEDFRIYEDKKTYNPFDISKNTSIAKNFKIIRNINGEFVDTDLFGDVIDTFQKRNNDMEVETETKNVKYKLNTNKGQLGRQ